MGSHRLLRVPLSTTRVVDLISPVCIEERGIDHPCNQRNGAHGRAVNTVVGEYVVTTTVNLGVCV